jgi:putrescine transport system substrate-binding protein
MRTLLLILTATALLSCSRQPSGGSTASPGATADDRRLNLYIWADYLGPATLANFEARTGIKVSASFFDTNETLETKVLTGNSGFDVVVPTAPYLERQIAAGAYQPLDKSKLPNLRNLDPQLMRMVARHDPDNRYAVIYIRGTEGIGYNVDAVKKLLPDHRLDSWSLIFDPANASKLAACGIQIMDNPGGVIRLVLAYLHKDPNAPSAADLEAAERTLLKIRPYVRTIDSFNSTEALANADVCALVGYNGDVSLAEARLRDRKSPMKLGYILPKEGSIMWFDMLAIPKDAPHPAAAHAFINYVLEPAVMADVSNHMAYANANTASTPLVNPAILDDPVIYPSAADSQRLFVQLADSPDKARTLTRIWQRFKTGQ